MNPGPFAAQTNVGPVLVTPWVSVFKEAITQRVLRLTHAILLVNEVVDGDHPHCYLLSGVCNPSTGNCSAPLQPNGLMCPPPTDATCRIS
jgi:hypothetical protein